MGWEKMVDEGVLEPVWSVGPILPPSLIEVLAQKAESEEQEALDEEDGEHNAEEEELEMEDINFKDLFSDDEDESFITEMFFFVQNQICPLFLRCFAVIVQK